MTPKSYIPRKRPLYTQGVTFKIKTGCGKLYVTINGDEQGLCEVFATLGKAGGCPSSHLQALARQISLSLRSYTDVRSIIKNLRGICCPNPVRIKEGLVLSCADAFGNVIETYLKEIRPT